MSALSQKLPRERVEAQVELDDGREIVLTMFIAPHQRLSDLLNEPRPFIPVETTEGFFMVLAKTAIRSALPINEGQAAVSDPFHMLGLPESASNDDVRAAYKDRFAQFDPARVLALGLPRGFADFAVAQRARITDAFHRIARQRGFYRDLAA